MGRRSGIGSPEQGETMASPMDVATAGRHGRIGRRLARLPVAHGDRTRALIRKPERADAVRAKLNGEYIDPPLV